jgi:hypothetical protein
MGLAVQGFELYHYTSDAPPQAGLILYKPIGAKSAIAVDAPGRTIQDYVALDKKDIPGGPSHRQIQVSPCELLWPIPGGPLLAGLNRLHTV